MAVVIIAKNQTASPLSLRRIGIPDNAIPASGQVTLTDFASVIEIQNDEQLMGYIVAGSVLLNDGIRDLTQAESTTMASPVVISTNAPTPTIRVRLATTAPGTLSTSFASGSILDGTVLATNDLILIKDQASGVENGVYVVNPSGSPSRAAALPSGSSASGLLIVVSEGTANASKLFVCSSPAGSDGVGTNPLTWTQVSGGGGGGAPVGASYVTLATDPTLTAERVLSGTANRVSVTDNGPGSTVVLSAPQDLHSGALPTFAGQNLTSRLQLAQITNPVGPFGSDMHLWAQADNGFGTLQVQEATGVERNLERDTFMVVRNVSGVTIPKMRCVCFTGTSSGVPTVDLADAGPYGLTSGNLAEAITTADIAHNAYGRICLKGLVTELNTSAFVDGDLLYLSTNGSGSLTTTAPAHPYRVQRVGRITQVHPVKGTIFFNPQGDLSYWSSNRVTVLGDPTSDPNVQGPTIISLSNVNGSLDLRGFHTGNRQLTLPDATGSLALLAGADKQIQFNDGGVSGGDADFTWDKTLNELFVAGDVKLNATTVSPATPGTDQLKIFARKLSNRILPAFIGPAGLDSPLQPSLFSNVCMMWLPLTGTSMTLWGGSTTNVGTLSNPTLATTNLQSAARRVRFATAAVANSFAGARGAQTTVWRGNAAGLGGFYFACRFSMSTNLANVRAFVGLNGNTAALGNADPSTIATDIIGVSLNSADANWTMITNDNAGACTTTNLGASFVKSTTAVYELRMFAKPNDTEIYWQMDRLDAAGSQSGSFLNTNLPRNTVFLNPYIWITNNAVASSAQIEMMRLYIESDL